MEWLLRHLVKTYWPEVREWLHRQIDNPNSTIDEALMLLVDRIAESIMEHVDNP